MCLHFTSLVDAIGDVCGYHGYKGSVDGVFTDVSCEGFIGVHCDTDNPKVGTVDNFDHMIYHCACKPGYRHSGTNAKECEKRSK